MNIVTVNCVRGVGSTGKLIRDIEMATRPMGCHFVHCYESGPAPQQENEYKITLNRYEYLFNYMWARMTGVKYGSGVWSTQRLVKKIRQVQPDIVHIHCPNTYSVNLYRLFRFLKKRRICTVITNHAEFFYTGNCPHAYDCMQFQNGCKNCTMVFDQKHPFWRNRTAYEWEQMKRSFVDYPYLKMVAVSPWQRKRMKLSPITAGLDACVITNGVDNRVFYPRPAEALGAKLAGDSNIVLFVTARFSTDPKDEKGGWYIRELAKSMQGEPVKFVVAGAVASCEDIPENMVLLGNISDQDLLAQYYSAADLSIIASRRETFGMACAESLNCGTPIVGFRAGGPESIALKEYSEFVEYGDLEQLRRCVLKWVSFKQRNHSRQIARDAQEAYSIENMARQYYALYCQMLEKKNKGL